MPVRVAMNVAYAVLVDGLDTEQRQQLDEKVYGWDQKNEAANRNLRVAMMGGGED